MFQISPEVLKNGDNNLEAKGKEITILNLPTSAPVVVQKSDPIVQPRFQVKKKKVEEEANPVVREQR